MAKPETFEKTEYSKPALDLGQVSGVVKQIFIELQRTRPNIAIWADMQGDLLKLHYKAYVMHLPVRLKQVEEEANGLMKEAMKHLKSEFKSKTKADLKVVEKKDLANYTVEKVSLNERYYYTRWCVYEVSL